MVSEAKARISQLFGGEVAFTRAVWTTPVGIESDRFLNCLCFVSTALAADEVRTALKNIELQCGSTHEERSRNIVRIDLDILRYDDTVMHEADWRRWYVKELIKECPFN